MKSLLKNSPIDARIPLKGSRKMLNTGRLVWKVICTAEMTISNAPLGDGYAYGKGGEPHHGGDGNNETGNTGYAGGVVIFYDT